MVDPTAPLHGLNWHWITLAATVPFLVGLVLAVPFWLKRQMTFGTVVGAAVIFAAAIGLILREHVELDAIILKCFEEGDVCFPSPPAFTRFATYAFIALFEVMALFWLSMVIEHRVRNREYSPEWR